MARNVALSENAYKEISKIKNAGESFSSVVLRLINKEEGRPSWRESVGALKSDKSAEKAFKIVLEGRHSWVARRIRW